MTSPQDKLTDAYSAIYEKKHIIGLGKGSRKRWQDNDGDGKWYEPGVDVKKVKEELEKTGLFNEAEIAAIISESECGCNQDPCVCDKEQIDELKAKTLGSYIAKGSKDLADRRFDQGDSEKRRWEPDEEDDKEDAKLDKREEGIARASKKLVKKVRKEEHEIVEDIADILAQLERKRIRQGGDPDESPLGKKTGRAMKDQQDKQRDKAGLNPDGSKKKKKTNEEVEVVAEKKNSKRVSQHPYGNNAETKAAKKEDDVIRKKLGLPKRMKPTKDYPWDDRHEAMDQLWDKVASHLTEIHELGGVKFKVVPFDESEVEEALNPKLAAIDAKNKENVAKQAAAAKSARDRKAADAAKFQAHKRDVLAKGGRPVDALDSWQKQKLQNGYEAKSEQDVIREVCGTGICIGAALAAGGTKAAAGGAVAAKAAGGAAAAKTAAAAKGASAAAGASKTAAAAKTATTAGSTGATASKGSSVMKDLGNFAKDQAAQRAAELPGEIGQSIADKVSSSSDNKGKKRETGPLGMSLPGSTHEKGD